MNVSLTNIKYIEWLSAEDMHADSLKWLSELEFIKDEQHFFNDLIASNMFELIDAKAFSKNKKIVEKLGELIAGTDTLIKAIKIHEGNLKIMVDGIDELAKESRYKDEHRTLAKKINQHSNLYKTIKTELFETMKAILKRKKLSKQLKP